MNGRQVMEGMKDMIEQGTMMDREEAHDKLIDMGGVDVVRGIDKGLQDCPYWGKVAQFHPIDFCITCENTPRCLYFHTWGRLTCIARYATEIASYGAEIPVVDTIH